MKAFVLRRSAFSPGRSATAEAIRLRRIVLTLCDVALTNAQRELSMVTLSVADPGTQEEAPLPFWFASTPDKCLDLGGGEGRLPPWLRNPEQISPDVHNIGISGTAERSNAILMVYLHCWTWTWKPIRIRTPNLMATFWGTETVPIAQ